MCWKGFFLLKFSKFCDTVDKPNTEASTGAELLSVAAFPAPQHGTVPYNSPNSVDHRTAHVPSLPSESLFFYLSPPQNAWVGSELRTARRTGFSLTPEVI